MTAIPTGTVTFLFTDIEGSTRLWEERAAEMRGALAEHDAIVRGAIDAHGGYVFSTGGDGFGAAFQRAADAAAAAERAQAGLAGHRLIRVRMGLHTGEVQERDGDYFGPAVNRASRIMTAGHGGQVLLSQTTADLLGRGYVLVDLDEHRFAGLSSAQRVFQLGSESFPPLRSSTAVVSNLPVERSVFVGRERELAAVAGFVRSGRVVTLTGVGGVGKTRLAIQVAAGLVEEFPAGVWLVELAPLIDSALVAGAVASAIGAPPSPGVEPIEVACRFLEHKRALVVLDNCEHVIDAAAALVDRLADAAPRTNVVATSREPLSVRGEVVWRVPSLSVADDATGDAVALFAERAGQVRSGFALDDANRDAVVRVCRRLDGIPLAIELAAARARSMSVEQIASRLDERFRLLTRGGRTAVPRQQTLQGAIDWSYDLLADDERDLFDRLAVFAGEFDVMAAAAVGGVEDFEALDLLEQLADKSMVEADPAKDHYRLLETLRQYGWDRLTASGHLAEARDAHAAYFAGVVGDAVEVMRTAGRQVEALDRLDAQYDNLRAALAYLIDSRDADAATRLVRRLGGLFNVRHPREGLAWFQAVIEIADELPARVRARLHTDAAHAAMNAGDLGNEFAYAQNAIDDGGSEAPALAHAFLADWHLWNDEPQDALEHLERAVAAAQDPLTTMMVGPMRIQASSSLGDEAETRIQVAVLISQAETLADPTFLAAAFQIGGQALAVLGHTDEAVVHYEAALRHVAAAGETMTNIVLATLAVEIDDPERAAALLRVAIPLARNQVGAKFQIYPMVAAAKIAGNHGRSHESAQLLGATERCFEHAGVKGNRYSLLWRDRILEQLAAILGADAVAHDLEVGRRLSADDALKLALDCLPESR